jgi:UDP-N-acetylmuramate-alanine ligase
MIPFVQVLALVALHTNEARPLSHHAQLNTAVVSAARKASQALSTFQGVKRRFEFLGEVRGLRVYDDYAHHPTEVRATLQAARQKFPKKKIWVVFQPHTFRCDWLLAFFQEKINQYAGRILVVHLADIASWCSNPTRSVGRVLVSTTEACDSLLQLYMLVVYAGRDVPIVNVILEVLKKHFLEVNYGSCFDPTLSGLPTGCVLAFNNPSLNLLVFAQV